MDRYVTLRQDQSQPPGESATGRTPSLGALDVLILGAWFALLAGLLEVAVLFFRQSILGQIIMLSRHYVWMAPVGNLLLYAGPALVLALLVRRWPTAVTRARVSGVFAFLAALGLVFMFPRLHRLAMLVLAAGIAMQIVRYVSARPLAFSRFVRSSLPLLGVAVLAVGSVVGAAGWWRERRALAALPPADSAAPNVLLIILDTVRAASLSLYGYNRPTTPNLERIAKKGVIFDRAIATAPWTLPSHASMFTGCYPQELTADWRVPLDDSAPTLAEVLSKRGYLTAGFVANAFYASYQHGLDRGFSHYEDYGISVGEVLNSSSLGFLIFAGRPGFTGNVLRRLVNNFEFLGRKRAPEINADFLSWLSKKDDRPYFAFLNYFDAHWPYTPPSELKRAFGVKETSLNVYQRLRVSREKGESYDQNAYDASIAFLDRSLGELLDELERRNALDSTLVIITSDHGEQLGEHGLYAHGNSLYTQVLHVPLVMIFPGRIPAGGRHIGESVTLASLPATVLDVVNARGERHPLPGSSFAGLWSNGQASSDPVLAGVRKGMDTAKNAPLTKGDMQSLMEDTLHYILNGDGSMELYNIAADPHEEYDLARNDQSGTLSRRRDELKTVIRRDEGSRCNYKE